MSDPADQASAGPVTEEELRAELKEWLAQSWDPKVIVEAVPRLAAPPSGCG